MKDRQHVDAYKYGSKWIGLICYQLWPRHADDWSCPHEHSSEGYARRCAMAELERRAQEVQS